MIEQPTVLRNKSCIYCGADLSTVSSNKEHVIGRNFVPKGSLDRQWNLIANACEECNGEKAQLENDLSAITMRQTPTHADDIDLYLHDEYIRKSRRSISELTRRPVHQSGIEQKLAIPMGPAILSFTFTGPPRAEDERVFLLAEMHIQAFFYLITFQKSTGRGGHLCGEIFDVGMARRTDWGNATLTSFAEAIEDWDLNFRTLTAAGYFQAMIKKHPDAHCWSGTLEWNKSFRIALLFGDVERCRDVLKCLPQIPKRNIGNAGEDGLSVRKETPINPNGPDKFFGFKTDQS